MVNATIRDVARLAGVSLGTISNYLNENKAVSTVTSQKIEAAIEKLDFVPNSAVRVLHGHLSHVIAFIVPDGGNPFFQEIAKGIEDVAISERHVVVACNTEGTPEREGHYARALGEMRVRAAIAVASPTTHSMLVRLSRTGTRGVVLGPRDPKFSSVDVDDRTGGRLAMRHVIERGYERLLFFGGPAAGPAIEGRTAGYADELRAAGRDPGELLRLDSASGSPSARSAAARAILDLPDLPDAVLCANDLLALALEAEAIRAGIRIPEDLAIVGYDDIESARTAPIPLTTVHAPAYEIGCRAAQLAFASSSAPAEHVSLEPSLLSRWSTDGAPEAGSAYNRRRLNRS
ncbi:MAG: LacI family DNA-binding transcriptional regulator [Kineosporiaceae bacterium]|nr:LacI family DNA-binding transcriptional regulator [Aeromicrobium sp.]